MMLKRLPSPRPERLSRACLSAQGIISGIFARARAHTPDVIELTGMAAIDYAAWRFNVTLGILVIGLTLVLIANQMGGSDGDDGPPPGA